MGEALISRAGGGEGDAIIPITPGYHTILVTLKDYKGDLLKDMPLNCKDGSTYYNYTTNERGQVMYTCNSGSANILFNNNQSNGLKILGLNSCWTNIAAPIGMTNKVNITVNKGAEFYDLTSTTNFMIINRNCNINIVGGGGGGGSSYLSSDGINSVISGGGGGGYINNYSNVKMNGIYRFISGAGGRRAEAGSTNTTTWEREYAGTGGTSYIENTNMSAIGGTGGGANSFGIGGTGNGGICGGRYAFKAPENSPVDFAGGGGAMAEWASTASDDNTNVPGGTPYGGRSVWGGSISSGSRGGGGAAAPYSSTWSDRTKAGASGGAGMMRIVIQYD